MTGRSTGQVARAIDALRGGFTRDPEGLRRYALEAVCNLMNASGTAWYEFAMLDGRPRVARCERFEIPEAIARPLLNGEIQAWSHGDPRLPRPSWNRHFVMRESIYPDRERDFWASDLYQRCFAPTRTEDQLRMLVYHRGEFVAWVGGFRARGEPDFTRADVRRIASIADALADAFITARAVERARVPEEGCDLLITGTGQVEYASGRAWKWLEQPHARPLLERWVRRVDRNESREPVDLLDGHAVRWSRLEGGGKSRYLLHLTAPEPVRAHPCFALSPAQRRVAQLAAAGATVSEIASMLGMASTTARTHLRRVYELMHVSGRAELARALEDLPETRQKPAHARARRKQ